MNLRLTCTKCGARIDHYDDEGTESNNSMICDECGATYAVTITKIA